MKIHILNLANKKNEIANAAVWLLLSGFFAIFYWQTVLGLDVDWLQNRFYEILNGNADSPYNYRLLVPSLFNLVDSLSPLQTKHDYFIATFMVFLFSIGSLMKAISFSISKRSSVIALLFSSFFILLTLPMGGEQPWSYVDIGIYSLAYLAMIREWSTLAYIFILFLALLNRETGILLCLVPILTQLMTSGLNQSFKLYKNEIIILSSGITFFIGSRVFQGSATHVNTVAEVFLRNFTPEVFIINLIVYGGAFCWFFMGMRLKFSKTEKAFLIILFINVAFILFFGIFREIRMFVPYVFLFGILFSRKIQ